MQCYKLIHVYVDAPLEYFIYCNPQLLVTTHSSVSDVGGLHDKIDRKKAVESHNDLTLNQLLESFDSHSTEMKTSLSKFKTEVNDMTDKSLEQLSKPFSFLATWFVAQLVTCLFTNPTHHV